MSNKIPNQRIIDGRSKGGKTSAQLQREQAVSLYNANPNVCPQCESVISIKGNEKPSITRKRKFCNRSCAAKHNNKRSPKRKKKPCIECKKNNRTTWRSSYCDECREKRRFARSRDSTTLRQLKKKGNWHPKVRIHSRKKFSQTPEENVCRVCGYDKYIEVCHIEPVSSFPDTATLADVNHPSNLIPLCPNCHKEYDLGLIETLPPIE